jgi:alkylhydroperoxidase family enzyme
MNPRVNAFKVAPGAYKAMMGLETYLANCGLEKTLRELVKLRASLQRNKRQP